MGKTEWSQKVLGTFGRFAPFGNTGLSGDSGEIITLCDWPVGIALNLIQAMIETGIRLVSGSPCFQYVFVARGVSWLVTPLEQISGDLPLRSASASRGMDHRFSFQIRNVDRDGDIEAVLDASRGLFYITDRR